MTNHIGDDNKMVLMPTRLTSENGAKAALIGEFFESIIVQDMDCSECEENPCECEEPHDCTTAYRVAVSWTTIKAIYAAAVKHFAQQPTWRPIDPTNPDTLPGEDDSDEDGRVEIRRRDGLLMRINWRVLLVRIEHMTENGLIRNWNQYTNTFTHWAPRIKQLPPKWEGT